VFHGCFYNNATQREINENTHFGERGKCYFGRHYKRNIAKIGSDAPGLLPQFGVLLFSDFHVTPVPALLAIRSDYSRAIFSVQLTVLMPGFCTTRPNCRRSVISMTHAALIPNLGTICLDYGRTIIPVPLAIPVPALFAIQPNPGRSVVPVQFSMSIPVLCAVRLDHGWTTAAVRLAMLVLMLYPLQQTTRLYLSGHLV
jgi:hypothetical protein